MDAPSGHGRHSQLGRGGRDGCGHASGRHAADLQKAAIELQDSGYVADETAIKERVGRWAGSQSRGAQPEYG